MSWTRFFAVGLALALLLSACGPSASATPPSEPQSSGTASATDTATDTAEPSSSEPLTGTIRIIYNFGTAFTPIVVAKEEGLIEALAPGVDVEYTQATSGDQGVTAIGSGQAECATLGIPNQLVAWEAGLEFSLASGISYSPVRLMAMDESIGSLADLQGKGQIAVPSLTSVQAILLAEASRAEFGDSQALQSQILAAPHPEAVAGLLAGQIAAHFTTPPFIDQELAAGAHAVVDGEDLFDGPALQTNLACSNAFHEASPELYDLVVQAMNDAVDLIEADPEQAAAALVSASGDQLTPDAALAQLTSENASTFSTEIHGYDRMAEVMLENGFVDSIPDSSDEVVFPNVVLK